MEIHNEDFTMSHRPWHDILAAIAHKPL